MKGMTEDIKYNRSLEKELKNIIEMEVKAIKALGIDTKLDKTSRNHLFRQLDGMRKYHRELLERYLFEMDKWYN